MFRSKSMDSGEKTPLLPTKSPPVPHSSSSSSSSSAALTDSKYPQFCESMCFPLPPSPLIEFGSFSAATIPLEPNIEHLPDKDDSSRQVPMIPRPLETLQGIPIPPFLSKTYELVDDSSLDPIISWGPTGESFVVWDPAEFSRAVLPCHFKHNNFSSFVRQLNTYIAAEDVSVESITIGFRKSGTDRWEFANEDFLRGKRTLLKHINRRKSSQVQIVTQIGSSVEMGKPGVESEVQKLRREKDLLTQEVMQLRREHLVTVQKMDTLNQRMQSAEMRQKQMISFLAKLLQNPLFSGHLKQMKEQREIASTRVRRKFLKQQLPPSSSASDMPMAQQIVKYRSSFRDASASASLLPDTESGEGSAALLSVFEHTEGKQLHEHLLQDIVDKLGLDTGGQEFIGGCSESEDLKGKNLLSSQIDAGYPGIDYFLSLTGDVTPEEMASEDVTAGLTVNRPDSKTFAFKGKDVVNLETGDTAAGMEFLETFPEDTSQERMFLNVTAPGSDYGSEEGIWNIGLEAGENSLSPVPAVWDSLGQYNAQEMEEEEARSCSLWDLDLNTLEEDLEIDKYVGGESSLQERKDDGGQLNEHCPRDLDP